MLELSLTRVFDVILTTNMAYMVISCALFSFGLAGIYLVLRPGLTAREERLPAMAFLFGVSSLALLPIFNLLPFDYEQIPEHPFTQAVYFGGMYLALVIPFFLSGLTFAVLFSIYARSIQTLYFWDLTGAAMGCVLMIPLLSPIGPGGVLFVTAAFGLFASALLARSRRWSTAALGLGLLAAPALRSPDYFDFEEHLPKRGVKEARREGRVEFTRWDPVSKIDVLDQVRGAPAMGNTGARRKHIAYDGGTQSSHIYRFDGNYQRLRRAIETGEEELWDHFWHRGVLASHYLKRDSGQRVLVIGSAGGQETKSALMFGAVQVDAVEMVGAVVELGRERYAHFNGGIFLDPRVQVFVNEGRSFLRAREASYDIIQIHSNHTSSSIAAGTGAMSPAYLQTAEAYREFFSKLTEEGVLHVNHHVFPRMIVTAALAWSQMGKKDFQRHVLLFVMTGIEDPLPTLLIKMTPWTLEEVEELKRFFRDIGEGEVPFELLLNPVDPGGSYLSPEFFTDRLPREIANRMEFQIRPATDDRPFFNFLRKRIGRIEADPARFTDPPTAHLLNSQLRKDLVPMDLVHLIVTGAVSLLFACLFILLPLYRSAAGRARWSFKYAAMVYFSCLGAGFIVLELVFMQIFMKFVGYPVYTYALVIFTLLLGAGSGSLASEKMGISPFARWWWPFLGILAYGLLFTLIHQRVFDSFLAAPDEIRLVVAALLVLPFGFLLGIPFPLGILALQGTPAGAVAWAWGLNGLFTVIGSLLSVVLAIFFGFRVTILVALSIYAVAFLAFSRMRLQAADGRWAA